MHLVQAQIPSNSQYVAQLGLTEALRIQSWNKKVAGDQGLQTVFPGVGEAQGLLIHIPMVPFGFLGHFQAPKAGLHLSLDEGC